MTTDYTTLDAAIMEKIRAGARTSTIASSLTAMAKLHDPNRPPWRLIDRRLQAMRKAGVIAYSRADRRWTRVIGVVTMTEPQAGEGNPWPFPTGMFTGV